MSPRYSLRFETGERRGETIPITGARFSVGRRPGNSLQIGETSVSGRHAEIVVDGAGARLRDLGSTNGTKLDGERVSEAPLAHGVRVTFGSVELSFFDESFAAVIDGADARPDGAGAMRPADAVGDTPTAEPGELRVSAEQVARARKGSRLALFLAPVAILGVAAAWWFRSGGGGGEGVAVAAAPVVAVEGNLLADGYSFESEAPAWTALDGAPASFTPKSSARASGELGLGTDLVGEEWAAIASPAVAVTPGRELLVRARVRARGDASVALGIELVPAEAGAKGTAATGRPLAWTPRRRAVDPYEEVELAVRASEGYAAARVVVHALAESADGGSVDVDDVSLVERAPSEGSVLEQGGFRLALLGAPATGAVLVRSGGVLASEITLEPDAETRGAAAAPLACAGEANGFRIALPAGARLRVRLEPLALRSGCATLGPEGYSARSADFESAEVGTVLVGRDLDLFGLRCEPPLAVSARTTDGAMLLAFRASEAASVLVQTDFQAERARAHELARTADEAERAGRIGPCLAALGELLDRVPVQSELVARAEATRARLTRDGLAAVGALRAEFERARFFRLIDLFESLRARNQELAARYEGSDVVGEITALGADVDAELASLVARRDAHERERLRAILAGLRAGDAGDLARAVETYLAEHFGSDALPPEEPPER